MPTYFCCAADLGLLDLMAMQNKLPGLLLYSVALGGYNGDSLLQRGSVQTVLSLATKQPFNLNFTLDPLDAHRVRHQWFCVCRVFFWNALNG